MAQAAGVPWTRLELIKVLKLYCLTPFGRLHSRNADVVNLAVAIGRTPSAVALKMTNFAALDPTIDRRGMRNFSQLDRKVWEEFFSSIDDFVDQDDVALTGGLGDEMLPFEGFPEGLDVPTRSTARSGQQFFRGMLLASYDSRCALTDIDAPELLVASHIRPWAEDQPSRTNPRNGLLLNRLHDRAFEIGLLTFEEDMTLRFSSKLSPTTRDRLATNARPSLRLPRKFAPDPAHLAHHRKFVFQT
jgi:putative restriction endonuclease